LRQELTIQRRAFTLQLPKQVVPPEDQSPLETRPLEPEPERRPEPAAVHDPVLESYRQEADEDLASAVAANRDSRALKVLRERYGNQLPTHVQDILNPARAKARAAATQAATQKAEQLARTESESEAQSSETRDDI
jgi:hypothetical protein